MNDFVEDELQEVVKRLTELVVGEFHKYKLDDSISWDDCVIEEKIERAFKERFCIELTMAPTKPEPMKTPYEIYLQVIHHMQYWTGCEHDAIEWIKATEKARWEGEITTQEKDYFELLMTIIMHRLSITVVEGCAMVSLQHLREKVNFVGPAMSMFMLPNSITEGYSCDEQKLINFKHTFDKIFEQIERAGVTDPDYWHDAELMISSIVDGKSADFPLNKSFATARREISMMIECYKHQYEKAEETL